MNIDQAEQIRGLLLRLCEQYFNEAPELSMALEGYLREEVDTDPIIEVVRSQNREFNENSTDEPSRSRVS